MVVKECMDVADQKTMATTKYFVELLETNDPWQTCCHLA
jgi:hypothetical protein